MDRSPSLEAAPLAPRERRERGWPWLFYLAMLFWPWAGRTPSRVELLTALAAIAAFLPIYLYSFGRRDIYAFTGAALIAAIGFAALPILPSAIVFLIYAAAICGARADPRRAFAALGVLLAAIGLYTMLRRPPLYVWAPAAFFGTMTGVSAHLNARLRRTNHALQAAQAEIRRLSAAHERQRIARDLHDLLGHTLTAIAVKADLAVRLAQHTPELVGPELADIQRAARQALAETRQAVSGMKRPELAAEIERARAHLTAAGIAFEVDAPADPGALEATFAMIVREAATNTLRHSGARRCRLSLTREAAGWRLSFADDGAGEAGHQPETPSGHGLAGMRERIEAVGGALAVSTERGWRIEAVVPAKAGA